MDRPVNLKRHSHGVSRTPDVVGGAPVVDGTRVTTASLLDFFMRGFSHEAIRAQYPSLSLRQIEDGIRFECCRTCPCDACAWARELTLT